MCHVADFKIQPKLRAVVEDLHFHGNGAVDFQAAPLLDRLGAQLGEVIVELLAKRKEDLPVFDSNSQTLSCPSCILAEM